MIHTGRHFLQIPGPTNVPDRVLREIAQATIDHRGPEFADLGIEVLDRLRGVFRTRGPVVVFPSSGTGAAEAALANTLSPGDRILIFETGWFSHIAWRQVAERLGLIVEYVPGTWRRGASPETIEQRLKDDAAPRPEGGRRRAQRDVDRRRQPHRRCASRHESQRTPGAAHRRRDFFARLDRSAPRRVGNRRHGLRLAERADGAARPWIQRGVGESARGVGLGAPATIVLGLAGDAEVEQIGILSVHARDESSLRPARSAPDARRRGLRERARAPHAARQCDTRVRARVGTRHRPRGSG